MNKIIRNIQSKVLSKNWSILSKFSYEFHKSDGSWETQSREVYDRGNGVTILLYHPLQKKIILTKQFRLPTFINGHKDGMMIETCAGKLEIETPLECIKREVLEETGYKIDQAYEIFKLYMSPGSVTEFIHFYTARYDHQMKIESGGGNASEQENIEVLELNFDEAFAMIDSGEIQDAKTIILLQYAKLKSLI
jgi:GDP-mannose pyrophosphatase NudK